MKNLFILTISLLFIFSSCNNGEKEESTNAKEIESTAVKNNSIKTEIIKDSYFVNTTWLLESIGGEEIVYPADYIQNFVIFTGEAEGFELSGFAGCNNFKGKYDVGDHETIGVENIISTKKACSFMDLENNFFKVLNGVDTYKIDGYYMTFYKEGKEVAFFKDAKKHN